MRYLSDVIWRTPAVTARMLPRQLTVRFTVSLRSVMTMRRRLFLSIWRFFMAVPSSFSRRKRFIGMNLKHFLQWKNRVNQMKVYNMHKKNSEFCEVCAHFWWDTWYYIHRKNPPIHYIVFATPHKKKYLLQKRQLLPAVFFTLNE